MGPRAHLALQRGYIPIGGKHPRDLGQPFNEVWAKIREGYPPLVQAAMAARRSASWAGQQHAAGVTALRPATSPSPGGEREQRVIASALQPAERARILVQRRLGFVRRQPLQPKPRRGCAGDDLVASTSGPQIKGQIGVSYHPRCDESAKPLPPTSRYRKHDTRPARTRDERDRRCVC